jgi:hypothetical protein
MQILLGILIIATLAFLFVRIYQQFKDVDREIETLRKLLLRVDQKSSQEPVIESPGFPMCQGPVADEDHEERQRHADEDHA